MADEDIDCRQIMNQLQLQNQMLLDQNKQLGTLVDVLDKKFTRMLDIVADRSVIPTRTFVWLTTFIMLIAGVVAVGDKTASAIAEKMSKFSVHAGMEE